MSVSYFQNQHDHPWARFVNETGASITVTNPVFPSGFAFDSVTQSRWKSDGNKAVISTGAEHYFGFTTTRDVNMFSKYSGTFKVTYTTADGAVKSHNMPISGMRKFNAKLPNVVLVTLAFGANGAPIPYRMTRQDDTINGYQYYMTDDGAVGLWFNVPTTGSPTWILTKDDSVIGWHKTFLHVGQNTDSEAACMTFPSDGSYFGDTDNFNNTSDGVTSIGASNAAVVYQTWYRSSIGDSQGLRLIYFQNDLKNDSRRYWSTTAPASNPSVPSPNIPIYRADRQYYYNQTNTRSGNPSIGKTQNQVMSQIYNLSVKTNANKFQMFEWEIHDRGGKGYTRFVTQISGFTIDLWRAGITPSGQLMYRCRALEIGRSQQNGRISGWSSWIAFPNFLGFTIIPVRSSSDNGWIKISAGSYDTDYIYGDCGWDTKFTIDVRGGSFSREYPMMYPGQILAAGTNTQQGGALAPATYTVKAKYTHSSDNFINRSTSVLPGSTESAPVWIRDNKAHWGGKGMSTGTYTEGYQCCTANAHDSECAPSAAITAAKQVFYWGKDCPTFTGTNFNRRSDGNKWNSQYDVFYLDDTPPRGSRGGYGRNTHKQPQLNPWNPGSGNTDMSIGEFSSNVRSSYSEFELTFDLPQAWITADNTIRIEYQLQNGSWGRAIHLDGSSTYIHGYWCAWKVSELPAAARTGNQWALKSSNLPGRNNPTNPESGLRQGQMHTYVHRKNFEDLDPFGSHRGGSNYDAYRVTGPWKAGGHLGLGYVYTAANGQAWCVPFSPKPILNNTPIDAYRLRITNVDTGDSTDSFTLQMTESVNHARLAPFCEAYDDDDKDCS